MAAEGESATNVLGGFWGASRGELQELVQEHALPKPFPNSRAHSLATGGCCKMTEEKASPLRGECKWLGGVAVAQVFVDQRVRLHEFSRRKFEKVFNSWSLERVAVLGVIWDGAHGPRWRRRLGGHRQPNANGEFAPLAGVAASSR
jgi:hypothetical protein